MKIAMLGIKSLPAFGGADRVVEKILEQLPASHEYWVYVPKDSPAPARPYPAHIRRIPLPALKGKHAKAFSFFFLSTLHCLLIGRPDIAHVHNSDFGFFCCLLRLRPSMKILCTFHGNPYERAKWGRLARAYLRWSERCFIRCGHRLTTVAMNKKRELPPAVAERICYIPNGMDPVAPRAGVPASLPAGLRPGRYILFACGRLDSTKGLHHLLEARAREKIEEPLLVVGDFSHDAAYSARIQALAERLPSVVLLRELLPRDRLMDLLRSARVFVFPSEVEAMSMMLLEAIACGCLVVCSDIPANTDVVGADYPYVFPSGRAEALGRVLKAALADPAGPAAAERLNKHCAARFSWPTISREYMKLYEALAGNSRP